MEPHLKNFTEMHDQFLLDWNKAMQSGDTSALERMAEDYYVVFFNNGAAKPMIFNREEAIQGMKQSVQQHSGAKKKFHNRVIRLKEHGHAVVFYEQTLEKEGTILARLFTIENWQLISGEWLLVRETEEPVS
ncbi:hypothetical protein GCM10008986_18150 [Salinibacillus aidingensis]|uniref:DUF4440 domain-containing protein n=1 Tax=Salinibacillus aidingensis TaxID=237684 RepID=A0ABP3L4Z3_9BACI